MTIATHSSRPHARPSTLLIATLVLLAAACTKPRQDAPPTSAGAAHSDHSPKHGGVFFMAPDGWHHIEGTYPEEGVFRLHVYDDHTQPLDPRAISATMRLEDAPEESAKPLAYDAGTKTLVAELGLTPSLPVDLVVHVTFPPRDATTEPRPDLFDFRFTRVGGEPAPAAHGTGSHVHAAKHGGQIVEVEGHQHFELLHSGGWLMLFVLDENENTLQTEGMTASLTVLADGKPPEKLDLMGHGDHFMVQSPLAKDAAAVIVANVLMGGSTKTGRFELKPPPD